jgi:hypothetical protein
MKHPIIFPLFLPLGVCLSCASACASKGKITETEHYFRNCFFRAPASLAEMIVVVTETDNALFCWGLSTWQDTAFHTCGEDGAYNFKFISGFRRETESTL